MDDHKHLVESLATTTPWEQFRITEVHTAYSGKQAIDLMMEHHVDILLTDIRMPHMSGLELIAKVRELELEVECVLLTGYADFQYAKQAVELQAVSYLLKPVRDEELMKVLHSIADKLDRRRQELSQAQQAAVEERRRIAHDLHDILGYALTNTLMNLESVKQLIQEDREEGLRRLELSSELLRNGLMQVRSAVHTMEQGEAWVDLKEVLSKLLAETEKFTQVTVHRSFEIAEGNVDPGLARVMFHVVQEGITNGIRHGSASTFVFRLQQDSGVYVLSLWNDGKPYEGQSEGMGLRAMRERVENWGGSVSISGTKRPSGTIVTVSMPY